MSATAIASRRPRSRAEQRQDLLRAGERAALGVGPFVAFLTLFAFQIKIHAVAVDFRSAYWPAAVRLLHGASPYAATHAQIGAGTAFVYPALSAVLFAPFGLLSRDAGEVLYMCACIACVPATLRTLNVRDWRVYGLVMYWLPIYSGWQSSNVTLPLMLLIALAWRHRDRPLVAGAITAAAISLKPFVWPLGLWLLATRRWKAAAWALAWGAVFNLLAWGLVGFDEIHAYLRLSGQVTDALYRGGYSMLAVAHHLGFGRGAGKVLLLAVSAAVGGALIYKGAVKRDERAALTLAVALMLVASPLVWSHYFALLVIPVALSRPRLGWLWALPVLMWPLPPSTTVLGWQEAEAWAIAICCLAVLLRTTSGRAVASGPLPAPFVPVPKLNASS
jgi:alpha-1,2-mannosyltransferase